MPNNSLVIKSQIFSFCRFDPVLPHTPPPPPPHPIYTTLLLAKTFLFVKHHLLPINPHKIITNNHPSKKNNQKGISKNYLALSLMIHSDLF